MKTVNSISGGKTSAYLMANYPADFNVFSLVRVEDRKLLWMNGKDEKTRQLISDKLGKEFIGTVEMDEIIYTILDLEQFTGQSIQWITGETFEQVIRNHSNYLPNKMARFCTVDMKIVPIFNFLRENTELPVEMRIGYRPNEIKRADRMLEKAGEDGIELFKTVIDDTGKRNKWGEIAYRKAEFPLIKNNITKDIIHEYWRSKPVRFAYRNNCVGCINRQPLMISHMVTKDKRKVEWFDRQEQETGNTFLSGVSFKDILKFNQQGSLFEDDDFNECDSGYCGI